MTIATGPASKQVQTAAATLRVTWDENLYQATMKVLGEPPQAQSALAGAGLLVGSLALFALASVWLGWWSVSTLLVIIFVLFFHELGHYVGMRLFGYRDVRMFFIPFFGAAVSGIKYAVPVWQQATVLLLGPLPGLLLALALQWFYAPDASSTLAEVIRWLTIINAFNLLPLKPLDGGRVLDILFFARQPYLAAAFQLFAACGLAAIAWLAWDWVFTLLALFVLLTVSATFTQAKEARSLRAENLQLPDEIDALDDSQRREVFARAVQLSPGQQEPAALAGRFRAVYEHIVARRPTVFATILFLGLQLAGFGVSALIFFGGAEPAEVRAAEAADLRALRARIGNKDQEALAEYKSALTMREKYAVRNPTRGHAQHQLAVSHHSLGGFLQAMSRHGEALEHFEKALTLSERLVAKEPSVAKWQDGLSDSHKQLGDFYSAAGQPSKAMEQLAKALAIKERLVASEPANAYRRKSLADMQMHVGDQQIKMRQRGEAIALYKASLATTEKLAADASRHHSVARLYERIGNAHVASGSAAEGLEQFRNALTSHEQLLRSSPPDWLVEHSRVSKDGLLLKLTRVLLELQRTPEALEAYRTALANYEQIATGFEKNDTKQNGKPGPRTADMLGTLSRRALLARDFPKALASADRSLSLVPGRLSVEANRAHALLFLDRTEEAKALYLANKGQPVPGAEKRWEHVIGDDFASFQKAGLTHPMMPELGALLRGQ